VQVLSPDDDSTWKDFTIAIDAAAFGRTRDELRATLRAEGIDTRCYFDPPVHRQQSHAASADRPLPVTDRVAPEVVSLPLYPALAPTDVDRVAAVIADVAATPPSGRAS
jgi:dTDP-4-amino-4,6-dideoxygalactose transaminase